MNRYVCGVCGYVYDEGVGIPDSGIPAGSLWDSLPGDWVCPLCGAPKDVFNLDGPSVEVPPVEENKPVEAISSGTDYSAGELAIIFSNLSKGCKKQYREDASELFGLLADYYGQRSLKVGGQLKDLESLMVKDIDQLMPLGENAAESAGDRGAKRALLWSGKVTRMAQSLVKRYANEGQDLLVDTQAYVCEICGFVYIGDDLPEVCPVCKVPSMKISPIARG